MSSSLPSDQYAPLNFKLADTVNLAAYPGTYVPKLDQRRILAYEVLDALRSNNAESNLNNADTRLAEFGFAGLVVHRIVAGLLGGDVSPVVHGAHREPSATPASFERPLPLPEDATGAERASFDAVTAVYEDQVAGALESWQAEREAYTLASERQAWLSSWWKAEHVQQKYQELEADGAVSLGDGVAVYGWSESKQRPTMRVFDPGSYFPVLGSDMHEFPRKVHFAWVELGEDISENRLHRITYELAPIRPAGLDANGRPVPLSFNYEDRPNREDTLVFDADGELSAVSRVMPWGETTTETCYMSHYVWEQGDKLDWLSLDAESRSVIQPVTDIGINFIPVQHVPNTPSSVSHFGSSSLLLCVDLLEKLGAACMDLTEAAALAAGPAILASGVTVAAGTQIAPREVLEIGNGQVTTVNLAPSLDPLMGVADWMLSQVAVVSEVGKPVLGLTAGESNTSGVKVRLEQQPFVQMVERLRLVRREKYALGLKMVQRLAQFGGVLPDGPSPEVSVSFGDVISADASTVAAEVVSLLGAKAISRATAVGMLSAAGLAVGDVSEELARIGREDFAGAKDLADAIGDESAVARILGISTEGGELV